MTYQSYNKHCHNTNRMGVTIVKEIPLLRSPLTGITFNLDANTQNPLLAPSPPSPSAHLSPFTPFTSTPTLWTTPLCFTSSPLGHQPKFTLMKAVIYNSSISEAHRSNIIQFLILKSSHMIWFLKLTIATRSIPSCSSSENLWKSSAKWFAFFSAGGREII